MNKGILIFFISILILGGLSVLAQQSPPPGASPSAAAPVAPAPPPSQPAVAPSAPPSAPVPVVPIPPSNVPQIPVAAAPGGGLRPSLNDIEKNGSLRNKSPFMIPTDLYVRIKRKQGEKIVEGFIDNNVDPKVRWPIRNYNLVGVLSKVKNPKALISDKEGKVHVYRTKEFIANLGGYIAEIGNSEVIIIERNAEVKLKLKEK